MRFVVIACVVSCCLWVATDASMIDDFFTGVRDLWPKGNGKYLCFYNFVFMKIIFSNVFFTQM